VAVTYATTDREGREGTTPIILRIQRSGGTLGIQTIPWTGVPSGEVVMPSGESFRVNRVVKPGGSSYPESVRQEFGIPANAVIVELYNKTPAPKSVQRYKPWTPSVSRALGGPGSGNFGHAGRPGEIGGSGNSDRAKNEADVNEATKQQALAEKQTHPLANPPFVLGMEDGRAVRYVAAYGEEHMAAPLPDNIERGKLRECYKNASMTVLLNQELDYAEGFATNAKTGSFVFQHAWAVTKDGTVVDSTWDEPEKGQYFGVRYDRDKYLKYLYKAKHYGVLGSIDEHSRKAIDTGGNGLRKETRSLGDHPGHPFYGNQWTDAAGGDAKSRPATKSEMRPATAEDRTWLKEQHGIVVPPAYKNVQVTTDEAAELVATAVTAAGKTASYYSKSYADHQQAAKWARLIELHDKVESIQDKVNADIKGSGSEHYHEAMTLRLIMQTGLRNGGEEGEGVGASSLRTEHATVDGSNVRLQFKGKGGVEQDITVKDAVFAKYVRERQRAGEERMFPHTSDATLAYMKEASGGDFKVHDLRTYVGTTLAQKMVNEVVKADKLPKTKKEYKAFQKAITTAVSKKLGNTPTIALKSYIHPAVLKPYELRD
jgi:DNA topoisomerase-1